ncbi:MAG TPA: T9SS type A sorting domain-containing protein, partial [Niabella sp.]|nr:T9SS type A sorting domain-containing protein [Niabella sp.]
NPTIEFVFIKSKEVYVKAELFDVLGVKYEFKVENNSFRAEDVPSGAYMARLTDENGVRRMHRLIVIK